MSFGFLDVIFGGKELEIDTYKPPKRIWSYNTHVVNARWSKWSRNWLFLKLWEWLCQMYDFYFISCYFFCKNCLKTSILALWTTLVNACWPHVCYMIKYFWGLGRIYLKSLPPNITYRNAKLTMRGQNFFFCLQAVNGITTFKCGRFLGYVKTI